MSERVPKLILIDINNALQNILEFTDGMEFDDFVNDKKTVAAVERNFEIIGEATRQLPSDFVLSHHEIEWHKLISFRNVLIHEYFRIEVRIEWNIITEVVPGLKEKIQNLLSSLN